ncbi:EthD domain-containing protein [Novosphingobium cyanobacteriorum]|uniref:EthD domain-containing protein n=1 Tax=Novosphingobium cyanobacteriorum TaxID=3024215 RepID=A0ABT6CN34_9SPHN|nr:EthD domain-containing protein [Novosphingobium cyanobacteriorum]MDF8335331.1 EthD domain-containing protein [Novosphingobium cyanobacteriorum]
MITLLKRREGMSKADFIAYYESRHRLIGEKVLAGYATRYRRRHLHPADGQDAPHDFDVVLEIEFADQAACDACFAAMADEATMREIVEDEERLFDRGRMRSYTVEDHESVLPA